jgi:beta-lactamase class A
MSKLKSAQNQNIITQIATIAFAVLAVLAAAYFIRLWNGDEAEAQNAEIPVIQPVDTVTTEELGEMGQRINGVIAEHAEVQIAVSIINLNSGEQLDYGVNESYHGASTVKLVTASLYLQEVEAGEHTLDEIISGVSARKQLRRLIVNSDNEAWYALDGVMGNEALQQWGQDIGLSTYEAESRLMSANDYARLLKKIYRNELLNNEHTDLLMSFMKQADRTDLIKASIPASVEVYHKAGWLTDRVHDGAIVDNGVNPFVLVIFTKSNGDFDPQDATDIFRPVTQSAVDTFASD